MVHSHLLLKNSGFTLAETLMVVMLVGILATVATVQFIDFRDDAKSAITKDEMQAIKRGISGDSRVISSGQYTFPGYESDKLALPSTLTDLVLNPSTGNKTQDYDPLNRRGWRGPYVDDSSNIDYSKDGWNNTYIYDSANRKLRSRGPNGVDNSGGGDDLEISF